MTTTLRAVYAAGRVVTGISHSEAFSKLESHEKEGNNFLIGSFDENTGQFKSDETFFFAKKIVLIRHGETAESYETNPDPRLSVKGDLQVQDAIKKLLVNIPEIFSYKIFTSPYKRTLETASYFAEAFDTKVTILPSLAEHPEGKVHIRNRWLRYPEFNWDIHDRFYDFDVETSAQRQSRIKKTLSLVPSKSILISHCTFIAEAVKLIASVVPIIPPASITVIDHNKVTLFEKSL